MEIVKKYWFIGFLLLLGVGIMMGINSNVEDLSIKRCRIEEDRPNCYLFYGLAQNDIDKNRELKVNYLVEGFPTAPHDVFVELIDSDGVEDFLYSTSHLGTHKAHYTKHTKQRVYKEVYRIPKDLKKGIYRLKVTFQFKFSFGTKDVVSNLIKFEVK